MSNDFKKTIIINPEIFNISAKTKKNRDKKQPINIPLISPNILKNKLLKRIKEHKTNEITENKNIHVNNDIKYTNEFNDSIEYLQSLSNKNKKDEYEKQKQRYKEELSRKTLRNNFSINTENLTQPYVQLELPDELKQNYYNNVDNISQPIKLNYNIDKDIPYGCLKGGFKKTYRNYKTNCNNQISEENISEREFKLNKLKEKMLSKRQSEIINNSNLQNDSYSTETPKLLVNTETPKSFVNTETPKLLVNTETPKSFVNNELNNNDTSNEISSNQPITKLIKQTTLKKHILGKSRNQKTVSIFIKDKNTQKKILNAQKELKKKDLPSIKKYLHSHNLMMAGSNAPNDVIRKMYESAILSGEVTNKNKEIIIHNLMKQ
jgi:hypothetical protein